MARQSLRHWPWLASAGVVLCVLLGTVHAAEVEPDPAAFLQQTESVRTTDHPRFLRMLAQIHSESPRLTSAQQWYLRYLDAWQSAFEGDSGRANTMLLDIMDHSGDISLEAKAAALLMHNYGLSNRYEDAFGLANKLASELPNVDDRLTRFIVLSNLSQLMMYSGQGELAIRYARMMEDTLPPGETLCNPLSIETSALYNSKQLTSSSPALQQAIDTCIAAGQPVFANTMRLLKGNLYLDEGHPNEALDLLRRIMPSINTNHYYPHMLAAQVELAQAYGKLGDDDNARKAALAAVAMSGPDDINEWLRDTYEV